MSKKTPQIRFKGFTDDWEERKLSDLFIKGGSGGTPKSTNKAFYDGDIPFLGISDITKSNGFINNTEKHISSDGLNSSAAWIVSKGAISLAMYASVGKLAILNIDAATSQAFYNMIFDDYDLRDLVYQRLNKANELSEWNKLISTGTQSNLNADKVKNFQMYLPKNHDEIKLISTFFKQIDNTIALHQRKLDLLKEQKKGFLQKMFPKNGAKIPELRFAGFADDWEERKLGEVATLSSSKRIHLSDYVTEGIPFYRGSEISTGGITGNQELFISKEKFDEIKEKYGVPSEGDLLVTAVGTLGNLWEVDSRRFYYKDGNLIQISKMQVNSDYLLTYFTGGIGKKRLLDSAAGSNQKALTMAKMREITVDFPSEDEQQKIGAFFKSLDDTIALHQRKLDLLKEQKKGFLQKMFVS
ncbi:restriction endonuclease subunit S [Leuconostoc mesenteroides]|uniref:restriction endonuclease subunit S n=1 Tax=Leuconostoc mesenteroides TaxID=1245 RepID=UPI001CBE1452|nr:restriction endonuclease subunit S [Leuconostoc mesenteroides]MBZ1509424.1 restriction endonuclease subunit S [Leuconostoc mesenteroides]MBZ1534108.1 restriction endonuclease subunit S [Leuconostoc mesenteroides]